MVLLVQEPVLSGWKVSSKYQPKRSLWASLAGPGFLTGSIKYFTFIQSSIYPRHKTTFIIRNTAAELLQNWTSFTRHFFIICVEKKDKANLNCPVSRVQKELKLCFKASPAVAEGELPQVLPGCGEQFHGETDGTCIAELGVPWKIYKMRMGLKISDGCVKITTLHQIILKWGIFPETQSCTLWRF